MNRLLRVFAVLALALNCAPAGGQVILSRKAGVSTEASGPAAAAAAVAHALPPGLAPELEGTAPAPPAVASAPAAGVSAWVEPEVTNGGGLQQFGIWSLGRLLQLFVAVFLMVLCAYFIIVSSRHLVANWEAEQDSTEWRPFAKAGKQGSAYGSGVQMGDDNPWREGSGLQVKMAGGYAPGSKPLPPLASSQTKVKPEEWDKLPSWA
jgi:hypothetical protein